MNTITTRRNAEFKDSNGPKRFTRFEQLWYGKGPEWSDFRRLDGALGDLVWTPPPQTDREQERAARAELRRAKRKARRSRKDPVWAEERKSLLTFCTAVVLLASASLLVGCEEPVGPDSDQAYSGAVDECRPGENPCSEDEACVYTSGFFACLPALPEGTACLPGTDSICAQGSECRFNEATGYYACLSDECIPGEPSSPCSGTEICAYEDGRFQCLPAVGLGQECDPEGDEGPPALCQEPLSCQYVPARGMRCVATEAFTECTLEEAWTCGAAMVCKAVEGVAEGAGVCIIKECFSKQDCLDMPDYGEGHSCINGQCKVVSDCITGQPLDFAE